ncbi:MAG: helix-turn-helix transcriptional regulator [Mycobacteriales bacterium]
MERAYDRVARLATEASTLPGLWEQANEVISEVVPHYTAPCWYTLDPASLLITSHFNPYMPELPPEALTLEIYDDDVNRLADVARSPEGLSTLHDATGGDPSSSPRWHANMAMGGDQEMIASLRDRSGQVWGALGLYREPERPMFDAAEKRFVSAIAPLLAEGARRGLLLGEAQDPDRPDAPGLVVVNDQREIESMTAGTAELLADLPDGDLDTGRLPSAVVSVAARTLRCAAPGTVSTELMQSRVLCRSGRWVVLHGAMLGAVGTRRVAVIVEPAQPARIAPLLMAAYGLTEREQEVTRLVLCGYSTTEIADALVVSPHTVQQHLKGVFDKTGVRSRRDLTGQVFFSHYEPRLRDNEARVPTGQALRGGPVPRPVDG